ncbi:MAG: transporter, partial [Glaciihabitans sp.]|nr:transporter [Glaciihabitans sp.]
RVRAEYNAYAAELGIVCASPGAPIRTLSGGNQQKVLLARWLAAAPKVLLLNDPSRGVDHPTKVAMYDLYRRLADTGTAVVLLSSEIEELLMVADSTVVFRDGSVQAILSRQKMTRQNILSAMFGVENE